ncbi:MAG: DUF2062 domain-containing protein [Prolixibacteraceae bacterium]|nr:DUF2062 domain-containing protein [Prolixibacteraceae bacterium]MBN2774288.1 DUF2062 domain-containing protein [Prolixibacteraceae bacterium]
MKIRLKNKSFGKLLNLKGNPENIARGFALGSFIGMMPVPGFQMIISSFIAAILRWNKTAAIAGVFNTNLATGAFIFAFNFWLGKKILGFDAAFEFPSKIGFSFVKIVAQAGSEVFFSMLAGGLLTGIISAVATYHISLFILNRKHKKQNESN